MGKFCCQNSCSTSVFASRKRFAFPARELLLYFFNLFVFCFFLLHNSFTLKSIKFNISVQRERWYFRYYKFTKNTQLDFKLQNNISVIKINVEIQLYLSIALCRDD